MKDIKIRLLLVEDDKVDQMAFERYAKNNKLPYDYTIAGSVAEAERIIKSISFDVIISDYVLGDGTFYPDLKRLFMSGYTANVIAHHGVLNEGVHFIQKPFSKRELATTVRKALDEAKGSAQG